MGMDFKGRVAIVTGAGGGLGKQHALLLASRGAKVLVNDLGGDVHGEGGSVSAAQKVVDEIRAAGGEAMANGASVTDFEAVQKMVQQAMDAWGRVDILVNNAGILRDKSFAKMDLADFKLVMDVHVMGAVHRAHDVHLHHQAKVGQFHLGKTLVAQDARVVDQDVHTAPGVDRLLHHFLHRVEVGHRGPVGHGLTACGADFVHHRLRGRDRTAHAMHITAQVIDQHLGTPRRQRQGVLLAQTTACACHDGHAAFEIDAHGKTSLFG